jgi:hypothetical protein
MTDARRLRGIPERIGEHLIDADGNAAPSDVVAAVVEDKAARLEDAPVQEFVPLLVENRARDDLRQRGMKVDWKAFQEGGTADADDGH